MIKKLALNPQISKFQWNFFRPQEDDLDDEDLPDWLRDELDQAGGGGGVRSASYGGRRGVGSAPSGERGTGGVQAPRVSSAAAAEMLSSKTLDYRRKLEREFNQKQVAFCDVLHMLSRS